MITYPPGEITPNQARRLLEGKEPQISYRAYDDSATFHLMGPLAPIAGVQEGLTIARESIKGLIPTWQTLDQAGANQDGVTFNDAVYQPAEIDMMVEAQGLTPEGTRRVIRDWVASWDAHQQGELSVFTQENGLWWAPVRWLKAPTDPLMRAQSLRQRFLWTCRIDDAFWRTFDSVSSYGFDYNDMTDTTFGGVATSSGLGANWPLYYTGASGVIASTGTQAVWKASGSATRQVVCGPYKNFSTATDNQVVNIVLAGFPGASLPESSYNDIWGRMGKDGSGNWNGNGVRARFGVGYVELARFNSFSPTVLTSRPLIIPPAVGEKWTLVCGYEGSARTFRVMRDGIEVLSHVESGTGSVVNSSHRGIGFGMQASAGVAGLTQATPAPVRKISSGVNASSTQEGFVSLTNVGDVEAWPRYLLYGPGYFSLGNGPSATEHVEFGPLLPNQVVLIETEPRRRSVVDVSPTAPAAQQYSPFQNLIRALVSFASNGNIPPLLEQFESLFGILPPQGNLYSYLNGRFTNPVPAKSPGEGPTTSQIYVNIQNGNASSKIVAALTPRRRWPL